ncbi:MAG TPA: nicotinic acid mononucleotide adenylyltransferase [Verrucomicrobia bacterium]|nr:nicotinic acid mononucleotide adenylyltransferase [Verrucomicrobiota bacterium]
MSERYGIFGGSFNPIHIGHLLLAQTALEWFDLDRVLFMPCAVQPHKEPGLLAPAAVRKTMIEAAIEDHPAFELLDIELQRGGVSYSVDSLRTIREKMPRAELFFMIGADTLLDLYAWKDIDKVLALCRFAVFARPGVVVRPDDIKLADPWPETLLKGLCFIRQLDISSSDIRHRVAEGLNIRYLVPPQVEMIISEHHLYR